MKTKTNMICLACALFTFTWVLSPIARGVTPPPDGCYPGYTTAQGCDALSLLTTGVGNTGLGWDALFFDSTGSYNTGVGAGALTLNNGDSNTATGAAALLLNTSGTENTAFGTDAMVYNDTGATNTAVGAFALFSNTDGSENTANGWEALYNNTTGAVNAASGGEALYSNTTGHRNTAVGQQALYSNTEGYRNTATGMSALFFNTTGNFNTAFGWTALDDNQTGSMNTALGFGAGYFLAGDNNIAIGTGGDPADSNTIRIGNVVEYTDPDPPNEVHPIHTATYIAGISGQTAADGVAVFINSDGKLGTLTSSARFKTEIKAIDKLSEAILALKPVTFRYKQKIDSKGIPQFGLLAEDVEKVNPDLVARDSDGKPFTVRYEAVNAMLLNEFLKEHRTVQAQQKEIETLRAELKEQRELIQKVNDEIELSSHVPKTVANDQR